jgi:hypothetical protein
MSVTYGGVNCEGLTTRCGATSPVTYSTFADSSRTDPAGADIRVSLSRHRDFIRDGPWPLLSADESTAEGLPFCAAFDLDVATGSEIERHSVSQA